MKKEFIFVQLVLAFFLLTALTQAADPPWCPLCSMNLKMYHQTNNRLTLLNGSTIQTCSIFCAAQIYEKKATEIEQWEVIDFSGKEFIDAKKAFWVIGSDVPGVMTAVGKIAFSSREEARKFQEVHSGTLGTFQDAFDRTLADMGSDRKMIMARVAKRAQMGKELAGKQGCFGCHGKEQKALSFSNPELIKKMSSRITIKETILKGTTGMEGYEGKLNEKDLHSITLYLWSLRSAH